MTKITQTKQYRIQGSEKIPAQERESTGSCKFCSKPIFISAGQIQRDSHGWCRGRGKHKVK